jgi:hypothetical protein
MFFFLAKLQKPQIKCKNLQLNILNNQKNCKKHIFAPKFLQNRSKIVKKHRKINQKGRKSGNLYKK